MNARQHVRVLVSGVLALALSVAGLSAAATAEASVTLALDHASPFMAGENIDYSVTATGFDDGAIVEVEGYDWYTSSWEPFDFLTLADNSASGTLVAGYLHGYEEFPLRATISDVSSPSVDVHVILLETTVSGDTPIVAGETSNLTLAAPVAWDGGLANLYVRTTTGTWKLVRTGIGIVGGVATVQVTPTAATRYRFSVLDESGAYEEYDSPEFVVDVVYGSMTVTPNTPDPIDATFIRGQSVTSTFGWGHRGTSDTVTLQWGRMNPAGGLSKPAIVWATQSTKKSLNGYAAFTWKPSAGHLYRYKVVRGGHTYYSPTFAITRAIVLTATAPRYVSPHVPFKVSVSTKGWARTYGDIFATKTVGNQHYVERFPAKYGKGTVTFTLPLGAQTEVEYEEQPLPGEWWTMPTATQSLDIIVRELKLYQSKSFAKGETVALAASVGDLSNGTGSVYARPVGVTTWYKVGSATFVNGVSHFTFTPSGTRQVKVVLDGQSTNVVTLSQQ